MKNFFKKLSFVMAAAMVITSLHVPAAKAATKDGVFVKGGNPITKKSIFVGGNTLNFDYKIGKFNNKGANGKWSSSDTSVIKVDKHGVVTAVGTGDAVLKLSVKKDTKKGIKKNLEYKVKMTAFARAKSVEIPASDAALSLKVGENKEVTPVFTNSVEGVNTTYKLFATSDNATDVAVSVEGSKVLVKANNVTATTATITVFAAQKDKAEDAAVNKHKVETTFKVDVITNLEVKQTGINKVKVMGNDLSTDAALYALKNAQGVPYSIKKDSLKVNETKTEAEFEVEVSALRKGTYKVSYNKGADVSFEVEEGKSAKIEFLPADKAAISTDKTNATIFFKVYDQFGNDITGKNIVNLSVNASGRITNEAKAKAGEIIVAKSDNSVFNAFTDRIIVTIVDLKNPSTTVNAQFTVEMESKVKEITFKGLYNPNTAKFIDGFVENMAGADVAGLYLLFDVKDQYGRPVDPVAGTKADLNVTLISATGLEREADSTDDHFKTVDGVKYLAYKLKTPATLRAGEVTVQAISKNFGTVASGKFNITEKVKVDTLTFDEGAKGLYAGETNELTYAAYDVNGNPVYDADVLNEAIAGISGFDSTGGESFAFVKDTKTGKAVLNFKVKADRKTGLDGTSNSTPVSLSGVTKTYKPFYKTLYVKNKRTPVAFLGLKDDVVTGATAGHNVQIKLKDLKFQDQYGMLMSAEDIAKLHGTDYKVTTTVAVDGTKAEFKLSPSSPYPGTALTNETAVAISEANLKDSTKFALNVTATENKGTAKAKMVITGLTNDREKEIEIKNIALADMERFELKAPELVPVKDLYSSIKPDHAHINATFGPEVFGYYQGTKIKLADTEFTVFNGDANVYFTRPSKDELKDVTSRTENYKVIINNGKATEVTGTYTVSKAIPVVTKVEKKAAASFVLGTNPAKWGGTSYDLKAQFDVKDQYGMTIDAAPYITYTFTDADKKVVGTTLKNNGFLGAEFALKATEKVSPVVKFTFPGAGVKFEEVIDFVHSN